MLLQSPYLTLEYLLWRNYNLCVNSCVLQVANLRVSYLNKSSRNLLSIISNDNTNLLLLKQYGGTEDKKSFISNEHIVISFLCSINPKITWLPAIRFYDNDNKLIAFEYLNDHLNLDLFDDTNETMAMLIDGGSWDKVRCKAQEIGKILCALHQSDIKKVDVWIAQNGLQVLQLDTARKYDAKDVAYLLTHWKATSLIHFDPRLNNFLHKNDSPLKLIDWELAIIGDPLWDLSITIHSICIFYNARFFNNPAKPSDFHEYQLVIKALIQAYANGVKINYKKLKVYLRLQIQKSGIMKSEINKNTINELFKYVPL